jgi:hypothetical protein
MFPSVSEIIKARRCANLLQLETIRKIFGDVEVDEPFRAISLQIMRSVTPKLTLRDRESVT